MIAIHIYNKRKDIYSYNNATHANELSEALHEVRDYLRGIWKHDPLEGVTAEKLIDDIWERFHDIAGKALEATE